MTHEIRWIKEGRVLYVAYQGHQSPDTLRSCLDDMALYLDTVTAPIVMIISWIEVTSSDRDVLRSQPGHRTYSHPMAARGVLVGFNPLEVMMNETTAMNTRGSKNTQYFPSMVEAMEYLEPMLA